MEKYTGAKTIGDGTYGSVLKAINKQNGKGQSPLHLAVEQGNADLVEILLRDANASVGFVNKNEGL